MWNIGFITRRVGEDIDLNEEFPIRRLKYAEYNLTQKQRRLLKRYGTKMEALMDGKIEPVFARGKHFVDMCNNLVEPNNKYESIWKSYLSTLEEEKRLAAIHHAEPIDPQKREQHIQSLFLGEVNPISEMIPQDNLTVRYNSNDDHTRTCIICRGSGMKGNGDNCDRCNGRGWIENY
jgi:uncharacterized protein YifE (UPF0438 family)